MFVLSKRTAKIKLAAFTGVVQRKDRKVYLYPWLYNLGKIFLHDFCILKWKTDNGTSTLS